MIIFWLAVLGATIVAAIVVGLALLFGRRAKASPRALAFWALRLWIFACILDLLVLYLAEAAIAGPDWGGQWLIWPLLLTGVFALFGGGVDRARAAINDFTHRINTGTFSGTFTPRGQQRSRRQSSFRVVDQDPPAATGVPASPLAGAAAIAL